MLPNPSLSVLDVALVLPVGASFGIVPGCEDDRYPESRLQVGDRWVPIGLLLFVSQPEYDLHVDAWVTRFRVLLPKAETRDMSMRLTAFAREHMLRLPFGTAADHQDLADSFGIASES